MPLYKTISITGGLIGIWKFTESVAELISSFAETELNDPNFRKYTHDKRRVEWLATRLLIRQLIGPEFKIEYLTTGKPVISHHQYRHLSISHSREFAAIILHEEFNVGIDIEEISRDYNRIEKRFLSEEELLYVAKNQSLQCLFWCAKEAVFKLVEDDGIDFKKQIHISDKQSKLLARFTCTAGDTTYPLYTETFDNNCLVWVLDSPASK